MSVTVIAPIYLPSYPVPVLIPSLLAQSDVEWRAILVHDGPGGDEWEAWKAFFADDRIRFSETRERGNVWGHDIREMALAEKAICTRYVLLTNGDNYLMPTVVARIAQQTADVVAWPIAHNYSGYSILHPRLMIGGIDLTSLAVRADLAKEIGFPWRDNAADFLWVQAIQRRTSDWCFLSDCLAVHN